MVGLLAIGAVVGIAAVAGPGGAGVAAAGSDPPNVVVVMTDDQARESIRVMKQVRRRLADRGTTFARSFVNWPVCCPSRVTFLTGQYAHNHGVLGNNPPLGGFRVFDDSRSLPLWLQDEGYTTGLVGKYLNGYGTAAPTYVPPGWSEWYAASGDPQSLYDYELNENGDLVHYGTDASDFKQDVLTEKALGFVERNSGPDPFFLFVSYTAPHDGGPSPNPQPPADCSGAPKPAPRHANAFDSEPLPRPPSFDEADVSDKPAEIQRLPRLSPAAEANIERAYRCRLESLLSVDEGVRELVRALRDSGEMANTTFIFTTDNGFFHGEHRVPTAKGKVYEPAIRVPLVVRGDGFPAGARVSAPTINADLAPTIAALAGATPDLEMDGTLLRPLAKDPPSAQDRDLLIESNKYTAIRTARHKYVEHETGERELYRLAPDPHELRSQHDQPKFAALEAKLAARLDKLRDCAGSSCRRR